MENFPNYNPFDTIISRLEQLQIRLDIISANLPREKTPIPPKDPYDILDTRAISLILGVPESTVRGYINDTDIDKALPAYKHGKGYRIQRSLLQEWIQNVFLNKNIERDKVNIAQESNVAPPFMYNHRKKGGIS